MAIAIVDINVGGGDRESIKNNKGGRRAGGGSKRPRGVTLVNKGHTVILGIGGWALHPSSWLLLRPPPSTSAKVAAVAAVNITKILSDISPSADHIELGLNVRRNSMSWNIVTSYSICYLLFFDW